MGTTVAAESAVRCVALIGNPNSGKTTLFNALTGLRQKVANYPGVTVEKREARLRGHDSIRLIDLPGAYSLSSRSPDEQIPRDVLLGLMPGVQRPDAVVIVLDASNLERNIYLASQVLDLSIPAIVVCNMIDRATEIGAPVDTEKLARALGVPVIATVASRHDGVAKLIETIAGAGFVRPPLRSWRLPAAAETRIEALAGWVANRMQMPVDTARGAALVWLSEGRDPQVPGDIVDLRLPQDVRDHIDRAATQIVGDGVADIGRSVVENRYDWIIGVVERCVDRKAEAGRIAAKSDRIDRVLTDHRWGGVILAGVMFAIFYAIFYLAEPFMSGIEFCQDWLADCVRLAMAEGALRDLMTDGVIGGVGAVLVFFPQICILFAFIAILEDSGYMARAAFLMHRIMQRVGLHGKSFIPLLSSYACAIPGIMAARTIEDRRDRLTTILIAPLMSCSARLPVYVTIAAVIFGDRHWLSASVLFSMYVIGTVAALLVAWILKRTLMRGATSHFIIELPPYHIPRPWPVIRTMWERSTKFLTGAGTTIFAVTIILWALQYFPRDTVGAAEALAARVTLAQQYGVESAEADVELWPDEAIESLDAVARQEQSSQLNHSWLGGIGRAIEPAIEPLGFDWKIGVGVAASFAAREAFISTMGLVYGAGDDVEGDASFHERMQAETWDHGPLKGRKVYTPASGLSVMIFYLFCCQCVSTLAVARRETQTWRWPAFMFAYMTVLAYGASFLTFQIVSRIQS